MSARGSDYWSRVVSVFTGAAVAQAIPILGSLIIARLYAPDAFGIFSTWLGISLVLTVCVTYRLEHAFGLEPDGEPRERLVVATVLLLLVTGAILLVCVLVTGILFGQAYGHMTPTLVVLLIPMSMGAALSLVWQSWAANNGDVRKLSYIRISQTLCITGLQILAGLVQPTALVLALAQVVGAWIAVLMGYRLIPFRHGLPGNASQAYVLVSNVLSKYRRFPALSLPADLINAAAAQMPIVVLTSRFGPEVAGFYALATRMMGAPISILGNAVRDVFKRSANEHFRSDGHCVGIYLRTLYVLLGCSVVMVAVVYPFSESIFALFFGDKWRMSGTIAAWLLPMYALRFIASPLSYTFYIVQKQNVDLIWQVSLLAMTGATLFLFVSYQDTLIYYSAGYAVLYLVYIYLSYLYSKGTQNLAVTR